MRIRQRRACAAAARQNQAAAIQHHNQLIAQQRQQQIVIGRDQNTNQIEIGQVNGGMQPPFQIPVQYPYCEFFCI